MDIFHLEEAEDTPEVMLNKQKGLLIISGKLLPEDSIEFFEPIEKWIREYAIQPNEKTTVNLKLEYMNSSSQKRIVEILNILKEMGNNGHDVEINWYYPEDDEDLFDEGEGFVKILGDSLNLISY